jgi:hypothetical protein
MSCIATEFCLGLIYLLRHFQHPFAAGVTLAGFNAVSVDENWLPAFIESTAGAVHKVITSTIRQSTYFVNPFRFRTYNLWLYISTPTPQVWRALLLPKP